MSTDGKEINLNVWPPQYSLADKVVSVLGGGEMQVNEIKLSPNSIQYLCTYVCGGDFKSQWFYAHEIEPCHKERLGFKINP